jgi:molybdopterin-containing oxidoreductase family molybdopterin binding subunit
MVITGCLGKPGTGVLYSYDGGPVNAEWASVPAAPKGVNIPDSRIQDVAEKGMLDDVAVPMKSLLTFAANVIGSGADRKAMESALRNFEFVVVPEIRMTDTCNYADLILPVSHWWERDDFLNGNSTPYIRICEKAVEPPYECLSDYEVARRIAEKLGFGEYFQGSETDNLEQILNSEANVEKGCTYADLKERKTVRTAEDGSYASPESFYMENARMNFFIDRPKPAANYGQAVDYKLWNLPAFVEDAEVLESSPLAEKYPLILFTPHTKYGTQTSFHHTKWLHEILVEPWVHINPTDAQVSGIADGDYVRMFNDRGETVARAKYNGGNMPGTMTLYHGWAKQYFKKGHYQELSSCNQSDELSNNASFFDVRVAIEPWEED